MKYILAVVAAIVFASCSPFGLNVAGYADKAESLDSAWAKTASYTYIPEEHDYWKSPKQFEADGGGDCEDFTGHLLYNLGEGEAVIVGFKRNGEQQYHCIIKFQGRYLEPQCYGQYLDIGKLGWKVVVEYSWGEYMSRVTGYGTRKI